MPDSLHRKLSAGTAFPLLVAYDSVGWLEGLTFDLDKPLADIVADEDRRLEVEGEVSSALFPADGDDPLAAGSPGILLLLEQELPYDRLGARASNILEAKGFRTWRDLAFLRPLDLMSFESFGAASLRRVCTMLVHDSIEALLGSGGDRAAPPSAAEPLDPSSPEGSQSDAAQVLERTSFDRTIADLAPELRLLPSDDPLPVGLLPTRLQHHYPDATWSQLLELRPSDLLGLPGVGLAAVGELLASLPMSVDEVPAAIAPLAPPATPLLVSTIEVVASWAATERGLTELSDLVRPVEGLEFPPRLGRLWQRLAAEPLEAFSLSQIRIGDLVSELLDRVEARDLRILRDRVLPSADRATLQELGDALGLTRERVRQLEGRSLSKIRGALDDEHFAPISDRAFDLRSRLGSALPSDSPALEGARRWATRDIHASHAASVWELLLWLAGPYDESNGWHVLRSGGPAPNAAALRSRAQPPGFVSEEVVHAVLDGLGIRAEWHDAWVEHCGGFQRVPGGLVDAVGDYLVQANRYLAFRGVPLTPEEILEGMGITNVHVRSFRRRLIDHPRIVRVGRVELALREWGLDEFTTIADQMVGEIERSGGSIALALLTKRLVGEFGVSPASVRNYASTPMFIRKHGQVRVRSSEDEPYALRDDFSSIAGCYELAPTKTSLRVRVDRDVLRGSGRRAPEQLAAWLGLYPGATTLTLASRIHPLHVSWKPSGQPTIGSLKAFADEFGASVGDWLILVFDRAGSVDVRLVEGESREEDPLQRLAAMVGIATRIDEDGEATLSRLAAAFGVDPHDVASLPLRLRHAVALRRDLEIAQLVESALPESAP